MACRPAPFENVQYFAPYKSDGFSLNTLRSNDALLHNVSSLTWGLREVLQYAEVLLNKDDVDAKADALIDFIRERIVDRDFSDPMLGNKRYLVRSFADLEAWFRDVLSAMEGKNNEGWRTHHVATIRKVRNRLSNISTRCAGLVTDDGAVSDLPFGSFQDRTVYVIDVASLEEAAQDLIFARVVTKLREHLEKRDLGVNHVIVFVDELNKYAPNDGQDTYVRKMLLDLAERGRYLGLVLFSAQQFRSQVHRRVVGNSGTALYGRMDADELATPGYAVLSPAVKTKLATLEKGQLMVRHPHFTQPIFVRFPRPAIMRGRDGAEQYPQARRRRSRRGRAAQPARARSVDHARLGAGRDRHSRRRRDHSRAERDAARAAGRRAEVLSRAAAAGRRGAAGRARRRRRRFGRRRATIRTDSERRCASRGVAGSSARCCSPSRTRVAGAQAITLQIKPHARRHAAHASRSADRDDRRASARARGEATRHGDRHDEDVLARDRRGELGQGNDGARRHRLRVADDDRRARRAPTPRRRGVRCAASAFASASRRTARSG